MPVFELLPPLRPADPPGTSWLLPFAITNVEFAESFSKSSLQKSPSGLSFLWTIRIPRNDNQRQVTEGTQFTDTLRTLVE